MAGITEADKRPRGYSTKIQIILVYIVTGSRNRRVYASLDVYKAQQTSFLTFLVEVHDLVVCFVQNRFLNSEARREALSMTYSCEVGAKLLPSSHRIVKLVLLWNVLPFPEESLHSPLIFYCTNLRNGKSTCLEWYVAIRIGPHFYTVFHCMIQLMYLKQFWFHSLPILFFS